MPQTPGEKCKLKKRVLFFQLFVSPTFYLSHSTRVTRRLKKKPNFSKGSQNSPQAQKSKTLTPNTF
jgi:hypothetical protein